MLKQIKLRKKIELKNQEKVVLEDQLKDIEKRSSDLEKAIEEAENEEDMNLLEEDVEKMDADKKELDTKKQLLEEEIKALTDELESIEEDNNVTPPETLQGENRSQNFERGNKQMTKREKMLEYLNQKDVREFYGQVRAAVLEKRSLENADITIPLTVIDRINTLIPKYSKLYDEVEVVSLGGQGRVILDGEIPEAVWLEMNEALTELSYQFNKVELDGFKVGGFVPLDNAIIEDSMINLAIYLEGRFARSIGKSLDKAIVNGKGVSQKQPEGVMNGLPDTNKVILNEAEVNLQNLISAISKIDCGDAEDGEIIAIMKRNVYLKYIAPKTIVSTSDGRQVMASLNEPNIAGIRVKFVPNMDDRQIIFGEFKKYLLGERAGMKFAESKDVKFVQDQTVFKCTARYDGKPSIKTAFVEVKIAQAQTPGV